ncbi:unnamed protein product [Gongylonema pulchrum]|uniref:Uncharacterized protein n=1 Tax=Gongylonema pulchrum TaxID=637853 RepID=A0A3P6RIA6_9BILA|nr:unnamed protein product [Gongylonema pulchrum]
MKSKKGGSAIVVGPKSSGKRSVIRKVLLDYTDDLEVVFIDGLIQTTDADALKVLDLSESDVVRFIQL